MAWTQVGNLRDDSMINLDRRLRDLSNQMDAQMAKAERDLDDAKAKLKAYDQGVLHRSAITGSSITVGSIRADRLVAAGGWMAPTETTYSLFNGYDEDAIRNRFAEKAEKERQEQERREVMAFYDDILTDEQKAAIGYDLLLEEYKRNETVESRALQYDLEQQALRLRDEAEKESKVTRTSGRVVEVDRTFADQVNLELRGLGEVDQYDQPSKGAFAKKPW